MIISRTFSEGYIWVVHLCWIWEDRCRLGMVCLYLGMGTGLGIIVSAFLEADWLIEDNQALQLDTEIAVDTHIQAYEQNVE